MPLNCGYLIKKIKFNKGLNNFYGSTGGQTLGSNTQPLTIATHRSRSESGSVYRKVVISSKDEIICPDKQFFYLKIVN